MSYQPLQNGTKVVVHTMRDSRHGVVLSSVDSLYKIKLDSGDVGWYVRYQIDPNRSQIWRNAKSV